MTEHLEKPQTAEIVLPGPNLKMEKQIEVIKAYVFYHEKHGTGASYKDIASVVGASPQNVSECLKFWRGLGMLEDDNGKSKPSKTLTAIVQKMEWGSDEDGWKLFRSAIGDSWFVSNLSVTFKLKKSMGEDEILNTLGLASRLPNRDKVEKPLKGLIQLLMISKVLIPAEEGRYTLNPDVAGRPAGANITVDDSKQMAQVKLGNETYAIDIEALWAFIKANGKTVDINVNSMGG